MLGKLSGNLGLDFSYIKLQTMKIVSYQYGSIMGVISIVQMQEQDET